MGRKYRVRQTSHYYAVRAASTGNVAVATLDAGQVLDGVTLVQGDLVLLKDQTTAAEDGIYQINADTVAASRVNSSHRQHKDFAVGNDVAGAVVVVAEGTANGGKTLLCYTEPAVVGTNGLTFIETDHPTKK